MEYIYAPCPKKNQKKKNPCEDTYGFRGFNALEKRAPFGHGELQIVRFQTEDELAL